MERNRVILDSNILIAFYIQQDSLHDDAFELLNTLAKSEILLPYCVIQEVATILSYKSGKEKANLFIDDIKQAENIFVLESDALEEMDFFQTLDKKLSFTDISLIFLSRKYNATLLSFDKDLINYYKRS